MKTQYSLEMTKVCVQCEKKVVFDILGMEDFVIALVNSLLNLSNRQVKFLGEWNQRLFVTVKRWTWLHCSLLIAQYRCF